MSIFITITTGRIICTPTDARHKIIVKNLNNVVPKINGKPRISSVKNSFSSVLARGFTSPRTWLFFILPYQSSTYVIHNHWSTGIPGISPWIAPPQSRAISLQTNNEQKIKRPSEYQRTTNNLFYSRHICWHRFLNFKCFFILLTFNR